MSDVYIKIQASGGGGTTPVGATLMKTGQTTSYRTGDDGDLEAGRDVDFFTLASNNPFGNTNRFTDELGGQTYTNDIVIDWSTYDNVAETVLGYRRTTNGSNITWNDAIDESLTLNIGGFSSGWRLPNVNEMSNLFHWGLSGGSLSYSQIAIGNALWTSTTVSNNTTRAYYRNGWVFTSAVKTTSSNLRYIPCRIFTVSGTTLS